MKITILNLQSKIPVDSKKVEKTARKTLSSEGIKETGEITVCFVDDARIRELNLKYLGKDSPTDVIAFDISSPLRPGKIFADIVVSGQRAIHNAGVFRTSPLYEAYLYVIHGILHILGYKDASSKERLVMRKKEKELMGILWPYLKPKH